MPRNNLKIKVFSGNSNLGLANELAKKLNIKLGEVEITKFPNSEKRIMVKEDVRDKICFLIQSFSNPTDENIMEFLLFCDALKRSEAEKIIAIIPYFGYARQNMQFREGECISANVVARLLSLYVDKIITVDIHDPTIEGFFNIPLINLKPYEVFYNEVKKIAHISKVCIVSPDSGGVKRAREFGEVIFRKNFFPMAVVDKKRDRQAVGKAESYDVFGDVKNKVVFIIDDILSSGGTLRRACDICLEKGAKKVFAFVTHHDLVDGVLEKLLNCKIEKIFTINTIADIWGLKDKKIFKELSAAELIAQEIKKYY